jgi:hypothetical protein
MSNASAFRPQIEPGGLRVPSGLSVSFQRYPRPDGNIIIEAPPSLGALPVGMDQNGNFVLPVADNEAFWIGLDPLAIESQIWLSVGIDVAGLGVLDPISGEIWACGKQSVIKVLKTGWINGIRRPDGRFDSFTRISADKKHYWCKELMFYILTERPENKVPVQPSPSSVCNSKCRFHIVMVDYETFTKRCGQKPPAPLDLEAGYRGWRLP